VGNGGCRETCISIFAYLCIYRNIKDDVPFKGEGIVTPCFPQFVNITILAKRLWKTQYV
jgi:hypothetical protein